MILCCFEMAVLSDITSLPPPYRQDAIYRLSLTNQQSLGLDCSPRLMPKVGISETQRGERVSVCEGRRERVSVCERETLGHFAIECFEVTLQINFFFLEWWSCPGEGGYSCQNWILSSRKKNLCRGIGCLAMSQCCPGFVYCTPVLARTKT